MADVEFFFDPMCPFAWQTSRWVQQVGRKRDLEVDWRFISLRMLNEDKDYGREFPPGYDDSHSRGLELLRVAASVRAGDGTDAVGRLYTAYGDRLWESEDGLDAPLRRRSDRSSVTEVLAAVGLDVSHAAAIADPDHDRTVRAETEEAIGRTGEGVGTPIVSYLPPDGLSFFGPVISRRPDDDEAVALWDAVCTLARFDGFAELKRAMRDPLDLPAVRAARERKRLAERKAS
jgi:2-hydroxychromene-2-carboxylate isomerase